jgi:hypothetical protein
MLPRDGAQLNMSPAKYTIMRMLRVWGKATLVYYMRRLSQLSMDESDDPEHRTDMMLSPANLALNAIKCNLSSFLNLAYSRDPIVDAADFFLQMIGAAIYSNRNSVADVCNFLFKMQFGNYYGSLFTDLVDILPIVEFSWLQSIAIRNFGSCLFAYSDGEVMDIERKLVLRESSYVLYSLISVDDVANSFWMLDRNELRIFPTLEHTIKTKMSDVHTSLLESIGSQGLYILRTKERLVEQVSHTPGNSDALGFHVDKGSKVSPKYGCLVMSYDVYNESFNDVHIGSKARSLNEISLLADSLIFPLTSTKDVVSLSRVRNVRMMECKSKWPPDCFYTTYVHGYTLDHKPCYTFVLIGGGLKTSYYFFGSPYDDCAHYIRYRMDLRDLCDAISDDGSSD